MSEQVEKQLDRLNNKVDECSTAIASVSTDLLWIKAYIKMTTTAVGALAMSVIGIVVKMLIGIP